jgi:chemotaxis protein MotB
VSQPPQQTVLIRRVKKSGGGHHGGAWKVAYADFVTAMMAFFLLLWLLNAVTDEQLEGISNYFAPISLKQTSSGSGGLLGGETIAATLQLPDPMGPPNGVDDTAPPRTDLADEVPEQAAQTPKKADAAMTKVDEQDLDTLLKKREEEQFAEAKEKILEAIGSSPRLKQLANSLLIDNTPEGLRIQILDQERLPMFPRGSAEMYLHTRKLIELISGVVLQMPQLLAITGHTDAVRYVTDNGYSNWELSADRANAARRALLHYGVPEERIAHVIGKAATEPLLPRDPEAPANRRLSVLLLRNTAEPVRTAALAR